MKKDKPTDTTEERRDIQNDGQASALFREAFYEEGRALEAEALASPFAEDEERKEELRRRIIEAAAEEGVWESAAETGKEGTPPEADRTEDKRKKGRVSYLLRGAAVLALVSIGVLGASMTSQAKGSGLWSTIQRIMGMETRWEQKNNDEDRSISDPEEYKAITEIEAELGIIVPEFFYWPGELKFSEYDISKEINRFMMVYTDGTKKLYFEGWMTDGDTSSNAVWQGEGRVRQVEYEGIAFTIMEIDSDDADTYYYVTWLSKDFQFSLSGKIDGEEIDKILKNIKI